MPTKTKKKSKGKLKSAASGRYTKGGAADTTYVEAKEKVLWRGLAIVTEDGLIVHDIDDDGPVVSQHKDMLMAVGGDRIVPVVLIERRGRG